MLVGEDNVGKTNLMRAIAKEWRVMEEADEQLQLTGATISTDGVQMLKCAFTWDNSSSNKQRIGRLMDGPIDVDVTFWDFAGQELYYSTHQFFLSDRSIYLLVCNIMKPIEDSRVEFWVHSIASKVRRPQIILVGTHLDLVPEPERTGALCCLFAVLIFVQLFLQG